MDTDDGEVYIIHDEGGDEGEWVSPTPAGQAVAEAVAGATDLDAEELGALDTYVDVADLRAVLDGDEDAVTFDVEGHEVTVDSSGTIEVQ